VPNKKKSLAETHPEVAKEWHSTLNENLTPNDVTSGSGKKVWWKCDKGADHEWDARISNRTNRSSGCPVCSGRKVVKSNCLSTTHPELAREWHPTKNGDVTPDDFTSGSHKKVWWKCSEGDDHIFENPIKAMSTVNCPVCYGRVIVKSNSLAVTHPEVAKEWHSTMNQDFTPDQIGFGSKKKVWWKCIEGEDHEWQGSVQSRTREIIGDKTPTRCPVCSGRKVVKSNCLSTTHPELAREWHPTKNGDVTPDDITYGSRTYIWWKCNKGVDHIYRSLVNSRTSQDTGCTVCSGQKVVKSNCLSTTHPELAREWHPTKNGDVTPDDFTSGSHKKVWWKCDKGDDHEWKTAIGDRSNGRNCPFCTLTPQSKQELTITFELKTLFKNINPKGLKTRLNGILRSIDIFIPKLNLCIEFDGAYWHKDDEQKDKIKSEMVFGEGFKLIRIREEPLEKLHDTDVVSKASYNGKQVANDVLSMIMEIYDLDDKLVSKIKEYQAKDKLQNEKGLDRYIDKILTEKAEKNK
jgi:DNA-directed RNA polymerase subunit RPC12/RpoP